MCMKTLPDRRTQGKDATRRPCRIRDRVRRMAHARARPPPPFRPIGGGHWTRGTLSISTGTGPATTRARAPSATAGGVPAEITLSRPMTVCRYPPGTSKWNKIEHRMFSFISMNWQGIPLEDYATIVNLIAGTRTRAGLKIAARLDRKIYEKGQKVTDDVWSEMALEPHDINPQ